MKTQQQINNIYGTQYHCSLEITQLSANKLLKQCEKPNRPV